MACFLGIITNIVSTYRMSHQNFVWYTMCTGKYCIWRTKHTTHAKFCNLYFIIYVWNIYMKLFCWNIYTLLSK